MLATLPLYQPRGAPRREASVWRLRLTGLQPGAVAAFLAHALPAERSLFRGVDRVPVDVPGLQREAGPEREERVLHLRPEAGPAQRVTNGEPVPGLTRAAGSMQAEQLKAEQAPAFMHAGGSATEDRLAETLLEALASVVRAHVASGARDVSLSGGVDSAALCALAAREASGQLRAWTMDVHFADAAERRNARMVARAAGVELVDVPVPDALLPDLLEPAVLSNETAILNARAVASFAFYAEARRLGASVMLSGAGADEMLLGNPAALSGARARVEKDRRLAREVLRPSAVDNLGAMPWDLAASDASEEVRHAAWVLRELVLPPELRGAGAHGVTVRTPYLEPGFTDVALSLPEAVLVREDTGKWLFRHAVRSLVADEVRLARKTPRYAHTALSSPVRERWLELYRAWLVPSRLEPLEVIDSGAALARLEHYARLSPESPEASGLDRLLMRLVSLAMLQSHACHE